MECGVRSICIVLIIICITVPVFAGVCDVSPQPCGISGVCVPTPGASPPGYKCRCYAGFIQQSPQNCTDRNECSQVATLCHNGTCVNTPGSFRCSCNQGYTGSHCRQKANPCDSSPCLNGGQCTPAASAAGYKCRCYAGYLQPNCADRNECNKVHNLCHNGTCINTPGSFRCNCSDGYMGSHCTQHDPCASSPCMNGRCSPSATPPGYTCQCYAGFNPPHCTDRDECGMVANLCHHGTCLNTPGSFKCNCNLGYSGSHCTNVFNPCVSSPCSNQGTCNVTANGYKCNCYPGFSPPNCQDKDECDFVSTLCHNGTCINTVGSYRCQCNTGYTGPHCTIRVASSSSSSPTSTTTPRTTTATTTTSTTTTTTSTTKTTSKTTTARTRRQTNRIIGTNNEPITTSWVASHWWIYLLAVGVVLCAGAAVTIAYFYRIKRSTEVGVYNKFDLDKTTPSSPTSPTPIQQNNPLYDAIQRQEIGDPDAATPTPDDDEGHYMTLGRHGNNDSEI